MNERRSSERRETFEYWTVTETGTGQVIGMTVDLNREGIRLHCKEPVKTGALLHVTIHLDKRIAGVEQVDLKLRCRWCRKTRPTNLNAAGCAVVSPSPEYVEVEQKLIDFFSMAVRTNESVM